MNKITVYIVIFLLLTASKFCLSQNETTMQDILEQVTEKIKELEKDKKQEIVNVTIDLLVLDAEKSFVRYLDPSFEYTIIAIGDRRIENLKLTINRQGKTNSEYVSENSGKIPMVHITLLDDEPFEFVVNAEKYSGNNITGHFAVIIYHKVP
jgi:hypothetical protein